MNVNELTIEYLSVRPPRNAILAAYLLQHSSTYPQFLGNVGNGQVEVLGELLTSDRYICSNGRR